MLSEDAKAIVASNLTSALASLIAAGWGVEDKGHKHPDPKVVVAEWFEEFLDNLGENE